MTDDNNRIAKEGVGIIFVSAVAMLFSLYFSTALGLVLLAWVFFCLYFFRNPKRVTPTTGMIAPADGKIIFIGKARESHFLNRDMQRITIFMSPFNVHVNRAPASGQVLAVDYRPGSFKAAFAPEASTLNERTAVHLKTPSGLEVVFVQIAGWFARRIVTYARPGDSLERGKIFGLIRFGSRMDVYLPAGLVPAVKIGEHVQAGQTVLAQKG